MCRANPACRNTAMVAADAVQELLGSRFAALRVVQSQRRPRAAERVARAVRLLTCSSEIRHRLPDLAAHFTALPPAWWSPVYVLPGRLPLRVLDYPWSDCPAGAVLSLTEPLAFFELDGDDPEYGYSTAFAIGAAGIIHLAELLGVTE